MNIDNSLRATEGACSAEQCDRMLVIFQVLSVSMAVIFGMTTIGKIIITLRSVLPQDKGIALAVEITFVGLFAFIPAHLAYDLVTRTYKILITLGTKIWRFCHLSRYRYHMPILGSSLRSLFVT